MELSSHAIHRTWNRFAQHFKRPPTTVAYAPGRVNLIGDHTDYNGGLALPAPINRWVYVAVVRTKLDKGPGFEVYSEDVGESRTWRKGMDAPEESWMRLVQGAYELWSTRFESEAAFQLYLWGDLPRGVGLSTSAALSVALLDGFAAASGNSLERLELSQLALRLEHEYLGLQSSLMDQMAVVFGKKDALLEIDFRDNSMHYHSPPLLDVQWVVVDSGLRPPLSDADFQQRVEESRTAFAVLQGLDPNLTHPREVTPKHLQALLYPPDGIPGPETVTTEKAIPGSPYSRQLLHDRMRHFITENERVKLFVQHLMGGDIWAAGDVLDASHKSLRDDYAVSCPEVDFLQSTAIQTKGCLGSRIMGRGFGGCTINMVVPERVDTFLDNLSHRYKAETGLSAKGFSFSWAEGAGVRGKL